MLVSFFSKNNSFSAKSIFCCIITAFLLIAPNGEGLYAQATLSLQGILKKANGIALEDNIYPITFKIYVVDSTQVKWMETIDEVEVISGIYSVILGANPMFPLNLAFDKDYELGISIGSQEMRPRVKLTSAPYALALRGSTNQFPSAGQVLADSILINGGIKVNNGVLAKGGAPGVNGANKAGYAFTGNNGDNDSGLFSTADGKASLYSNNVEILSVTPGTATVNGNLDIINNGSVKYNGFSDWRLVDVDDFTTSTDGWRAYPAKPGEWTGWNNADTTLLDRTVFGPFIGPVLVHRNRGDLLKKLFTLNSNGSFTQIKVKFKYYFFDSWDFDYVTTLAFAGFASNVLGENWKIAWASLHPSINFNNAFTLNNPPVVAATDINNIIVPNSGKFSDFSLDVEMTARANGSSFWVFIGGNMDGAPSNDEGYGIGPVEIWVR